MIIDGHAHACGIYSNGNSIIKYLDLHGIDMIVLCAGEPESNKNYDYPMLSDTFKSAFKALGSTKLILGSDTPYGVDNIQKIQNRLKQLSLPQKDLDNIMGNNLAKLLRLL